MTSRTIIALGMTLVLLAAVSASAKKKPLKRPPPAASAPAPSEPAAAPSESAPPPPAAVEAAPVPTPPPVTPPPAAAPAPSEAATSVNPGELEALNAEYNQLRDELFRSRAKVKLLGDALFKTRLLASFKYEAARTWPIKRVTLRVDDQQVFSADSPSTQDALKLYDGVAAPGRHTLTLKVECGAVGEERIAYATEGSFVVDLPDQKVTRVRFSVDETGDGPKRLAEKHEGEFDVRVRAALDTQERGK
jgi:hypothetical protein